MRLLAVALFVSGSWLLMTDSARSQKPKVDPMPPTLSARVEIDEHENSFTVRFFLKNTSEKDIEVVIGSVRSGLLVLPQFHVCEVTSHPPTYSRPPRRSMKNDVRQVPACKEILYGTFTMGYPPTARASTEKLTAVIEFKELKA